MEKKERKNYKKPEIFEVKLAPEEALLSGCKTSTGNVGSPPLNWKCSGKCNKNLGT